MKSNFVLLQIALPLIVVSNKTSIKIYLFHYFPQYSLIMNKKKFIFFIDGIPDAIRV